jgi:hypothetical protein
MGRPPIIETPEEFEALADLYFEGCQENNIMPTVNGLCLTLGMCRETLLRYEEKPGFSDTVKKHRMRLELAWEQRLAGTACTGAIFWLKNQGWTDKTETELYGKGGGPVATVNRIERVIVDPADSNS